MKKYIFAIIALIITASNAWGIDKHWNRTTYNSHMTINAKLILDGSNSNIQDLEMGIFSLDDECRGSDLPNWNSKKNAYIYNFRVSGNTENEELIIKFYDHATEQEIVYFNCNPATIEFNENDIITNDFCLNTKFTVTFVPTGNLNITNGQANVYVDNSTTPAAMKASTEMLNGKFDYGQTFTLKVADGYKIKNAEADNVQGTISDDRTEFSFELYNEDVSVSYELSESGYGLSTGTNDHGTIKFSIGGNEVTEAYEGDEVNVTVNADKGWQVNSVTADASTSWGNATTRSTSRGSIPFADITLTKVEGTTNQWRFTMPPADVKVSATYSQLILTVKADDKRVTFGATKPTYTVTYSGFIDGDDANTLGGTLSFTCSYSKGSSTGTYTITPKGLTSDKYDINYQSGTLTVTNASMSVSAKGYSGVYDGQGHSITVTKPSGATVRYRTTKTGSYNLSTNPTFTDVGEYTVYYQVSKSNYTSKSGSAKVTITAKELTVKADDVSKLFQAEDPTLTYQVEGLCGDDELTGSLERTEGEDVGTYAINQGTLSASNNYTIAFTPGNFEITAKTVDEPTIRLSETYYFYDGTAKEPTVTVEVGETTIPETEYTVSYSDNTEAGTATVTITDKPDGDYIVSGSTTFSITAKTVSSPTVTLEKTYYFYDGTAKTPTVTVKDGETVIPASEYTVGYSNNTNVGTATVTITDKDVGNYTVSGSATFEIGLKGDANGDNKVDAADIVEMVNETKGQTSAKFKKNNADIDGNGQITDADITEVAKIILAE